MYDPICILGHIKEGVIMERSFSEREKETIRKKLMDACKQSWTQYGYKKTALTSCGWCAASAVVVLRYFGKK